jgi:hypothetical protein
MITDKEILQQLKDHKKLQELKDEIFYRNIELFKKYLINAGIDIDTLTWNSGDIPTDLHQFWQWFEDGTIELKE